MYIEGVTKHPARPIIDAIPSIGDRVALMTPDFGSSRTEFVVMSEPTRVSRVFDGSVDRTLTKLATGFPFGAGVDAATAVFEAADGRVYTATLGVRDAAGGAAKLMALPKGNFTRASDTLRGIASHQMSVEFGESSTGRSMLTVLDA